MKMITRETILTIFTETDADTMQFCNDLIDGLRIINEYVGAVSVRCDGNRWLTVAVDTMLAYNFSEEDCEELSKLGWFIEAEYLVIDL